MKRKKYHLILPLLSLSLLCSLVCPFSVKATGQEEASDKAEQEQTTASEGWPEAPAIASSSAFLLEATTRTVLFEKAGEELLAPGSLVKIMTMLLALENSQLTDSVTFTQTGPSVAAAGAANIAARNGEILTMEQCLYAIMLSSANDVCMQVAEHVSGSVDAFVEQMNTKAADLGCTNTVFTNPTGLPDENQHSTAHDLALILMAAAANENYLAISSAAEYTIPATNMTGTPRALKNSFPLTAAGSANLYEGTLTGKAGYTQVSGSTLAAAAEQNGTRLIAVLLKGADVQTAVDAAALFDYGFHQFQRIQYADPDLTIDGGFAILPTGVTLDQITISEAAAEEGLNQTYYYQNRQVGYGLLQEIEDLTAPPESIDNEAYLKSLSQKKSMAPYYIIGATGIVLLTLLGFLMRKVLKA